MAEITVVEMPELSQENDKRYMVVDIESGKIIDDAQGYGFKTKKKAYAAYTYKTRDKSKDPERNALERKVKAWLKDHQAFCSLLEAASYEVAKGQWGPHKKFDSMLVKGLLEDCGLETEIKPEDILKVWSKGKIR